MKNKKEKGFLLGWNPDSKEWHWDYEKVYSEIKNGKKPIVEWTIQAVSYTHLDGRPGEIVLPVKIPVTYSRTERPHGALL